MADFRATALGWNWVFDALVNVAGSQRQTSANDRYRVIATLLPSLTRSASKVCLVGAPLPSRGCSRPTQLLNDIQRNILCPLHVHAKKCPKLGHFLEKPIATLLPSKTWPTSKALRGHPSPKTGP